MASENQLTPAGSRPHLLDLNEKEHRRWIARALRRVPHPLPSTPLITPNHLQGFAVQDHPCTGHPELTHVIHALLTSSLPPCLDLRSRRGTPNPPVDGSDWDFIPDIIPFKLRPPIIEAADITHDPLDVFMMQQDTLATSWVEWYGPLVTPFRLYGPEGGAAAFLAEVLNDVQMQDGVGNLLGMRVVDEDSSWIEVTRETLFLAALIESRNKEMEDLTEEFLGGMGYPGEVLESAPELKLYFLTCWPSERIEELAEGNEEGMMVGVGGGGEGEGYDEWEDEAEWNEFFQEEEQDDDAGMYEEGQGEQDENVQEDVPEMRNVLDLQKESVPFIQALQAHVAQRGEVVEGVREAEVSNESVDGHSGCNLV